MWLLRFMQAIRMLRWDTIRSNPGMVIAAVAVAGWVVAAVSATLIVVIGAHAAHALPAGPSVRLPASSLQPRPPP
jgi:hypothetical protein